MKHPTRKETEEAPSVLPQTYRPYFRENFVLYTMLFALGAGCLYAGLFKAVDVGSSIELGLFSLLLFLLWGLLRFRFFVRIDDEFLTSRGFLATQRIRWSDIQRFGNKVELTGNANTPPVMDEFQGSETSLSINFKLYSRDCHKTVLRMAASRSQDLK
jgi:hypothetical protein